MKKLIVFTLCACIAATAAFAQTRQQAKDEIARIERLSAQTNEMLRQAWEAGRTQTETVITTPYGNVTVKFNLDEIIKQTYTGAELTQKLRDWHGVMEGNELRINNGGSWRNATYEGLKITITHELGHYIMDRKNTTPTPVLNWDTGYRTSVDFSEIEADAFAMRYFDKAAYSENLRRAASSQAYINAVIRRMEEMEYEENLNRLRAIANAPTEAAARQEAERWDAARKEAAAQVAAREEAARQEAMRQQDPKKLFDIAKEAYDKEDYDNAIAYYTAVIRIEPKNIEAYISRAKSYIRKYDIGKGDYDKAIADYTEVLRINPNHMGAYEGLDNCYRFKKDYDKAIEVSSEYIRHFPRHSWAYFSRARSYIDKGDYDKAIADYTEAIRFDNAPSFYYGRRAQVYYKKGDFRQAREDLNKTLQLDPSYLRLDFARQLDADLKSKGY